MKKVIVIGCPGSGKSTVSRALHNKTGIPLYHLDMMYWNADKTTAEKSVFLERLSTVLEKDEWIIDGNYGSTMELRMAACDTVIFLDYPLDVCLTASKSDTESHAVICRGSKPRKMRNSSNLSKATTSSKSQRCLNCSKNTAIKTLSSLRAEQNQMRS